MAAGFGTVEKVSYDVAIEFHVPAIEGSLLPGPQLLLGDFCPQCSGDEAVVQWEAERWLWLLPIIFAGISKEESSPSCLLLT